MIRLVVMSGLFLLAACAAPPHGTDKVVPGANHSLATSSCTNGAPDLRQAKLGCPN